MQKSESIKSLIEGLVKAQTQFPSIPKSAKVDFVTKSGAKIKYSYTPLEEVIAAVRKPLADNGLALTQLIGTIEGKTSIETILGHVSGEWISGEYTIVGQATNPQEMGSLISYGRRYAIISILGISTDEDTDALDLVKEDKVKATTTKSTTGATHVSDKSESTAQREHYCSEHSCAYKEYHKGDSTWYSHWDNEKQKWCNEVKKKPELIGDDWDKLMEEGN